MNDLVKSRAREALTLNGFSTVEILGLLEKEPAPPIGLRDEFAKAAIPIAYARVGENEQGWHGIAKVAYLIADAMMEARG